MKKAIIVLCLFLLFGFSFGQSRIRVDGNRFVNEDGETVIFQGVSIADPDKLVREERWQERLFAEAASWGANIVRLPIHPRAWRERTPEKYLELVDQAIGWAKKHQLYLIIDWHSIGNLKEGLFQHEMYRTSLQETKEFWRQIAEAYKDEPTVAFYELFNEPTVTGSMQGMTFPQWQAILDTLIQEIREIDSTKVLLVAGFNWAYDLTEFKDNFFTEPNIAYVSHPYPMKREQPWEPKWEADWGFVADQYPVILTEIGFCLKGEKGEHVPVISTEAYGHAITAYCEKKGISWVAWVFDPDWAPMLFSDWNFTPTTQGRFFKNYWQKRAAR
ncbi:MAG: glycoside hydrolase family 5 protein [candidate division KSB1 bacterium]|nr:glycoside hydrolase family 5 protein [candidate division KSB1 bacterium]